MPPVFVKIFICAEALERSVNLKQRLGDKLFAREGSLKYQAPNSSVIVIGIITITYNIIFSDKLIEKLYKVWLIHTRHSPRQTKPVVRTERVTTDSSRVHHQSLIKTLAPDYRSYLERYPLVWPRPMDTVYFIQPLT